MSSFGGTVKLTGESEYKKALKEITSNLKLLNSEMKVATSQYDRNDKSVENLSSQNDVLNKKIAEQKNKVDILSKALEDAKSETGDNSEVTKKWQSQLNNAQAELNKLTLSVEKNEQSIKDSESEYKSFTKVLDDKKAKLDELKNAYIDVASSQGKNSTEAKELYQQYKKLNSEIEKGEKKIDSASKELDDLGKSSEDAKGDLKQLGDTLKKGVAVGFATVTAGAVALVSAIAGSVEATQQYRQNMGKLQTAFETNGHSAETATKTYKELQSVLGESDQAVEASNHLALLTDNEKDLQKWTDICTGVYATFGASLPIEGLTEATNETAKVGQVTGSLADALNWASISSEDWEKALGGNQKALKAFKKATKDGEKAEDAFNSALSACSSEQERQELIMNTLNGVYSKASKAYKETNKEVIASNKATERLNAVWAKVGSKSAPIVASFQEGIADLCESLIAMVDDVDVEGFQKTIKDGFSKLSQDVIPKLINALKWCAEHFNELKSVAVGFLTALAINKITTFAVSIGSTLVTAVKGLVSALKGATVAQEGLNGASNANPYILLASAVIGVAVALGSHFKSKAEEAEQKARNLAQEMYGLTEAEKEASDNANTMAESFRNSRDAMDENISSINSQYGYISKLKDELLGLVDAEGIVDEKNKTRVKFIIGELNEALGTEYTMTGNLINNYKDLTQNIAKTIEMKKAELLLTSSQEGYVNALKNKSQAEKDYYTNLQSLMEKKTEKAQLLADIEMLRDEQVELSKTYGHMGEINRIAKEIRAKRTQLDETEKILKKSEDAYNKNKKVLNGYYTDIGQYETAQMLALEGNTAEAAKVLSDREYYQQKYADSVGFASDEVRNTWEQEAIDAGVKAKLTRKNWENGVKGYTKEMVDEAEKNYQKALDAMGDAYDDASKVGGDLTNGLKGGMEGGRSSLITKAKSLVKSIIGAFRKEADSHSPSRKMIAFGEDMDEGAEIGLENGTKSLLSTAKSQTKQLIDVYNSASKEGQGALSFVGDVASEINSVMDDITTNIRTAIPTEFNANVATNINTSKINNQKTQNMLVSAFRDALKDVKVVMNDREMGTFVTDTVERVVFA